MNEFSNQALKKFIVVYKNGLFLQRLLESHFFGKNELGAIGKELFKGFLQENTFEMKNKKIQR